MRRLWSTRTGKIGIGVVVLALLAVTVGPWVYINVIKEDAPDRLTFADAAVPTTEPNNSAGDSASAATDGSTTTQAATAPADPGDVSGSWTVSSGSQVGYRVKEILFGQSTEGVGRTSDVTGAVTIDGTTVTAASFEADMTTVESDESRRDSQFRGRIMSTDQFPTATFELTAPISLDSIPDDLVEMTTAATGDLTLRGTTKPVTIDLTARRNGSNIEITGSITIVFDEWGIPNPSTPAISTEDEGELELLLVLSR